MKRTNFLRIEWNWEEEVYNELSEKYEYVEKWAEVEVTIDNNFDGGVEVDLTDGDELPDYEMDKLIDYAIESQWD